MDKRSVLAIFLILVVIVAGTMIQQRINPPIVDTLTADSAARVAAAPNTTTVAPRRDSAAKSVAAPASVGPAMAPAQTNAPATRAETTHVDVRGRQLHFVSPGASLASVTLTDYPDLKHRNGPLTLRPDIGDLIRYRIVNGADTIHLDRLTFTRSQTPHGVEFTSAMPAVRVRYDADTANYITHATISLANAAPGARLLVDLAPNLASGEANEVEDTRALAYGFRPKGNDVESETIAKLDTTYRVEEGPLEWVAIRSKYFVVAAMNPDSTTQFSSFVTRKGIVLPDGRVTGVATATLPLNAGTARLELYTGPQSWETLRAVGHELSNVNPYAGWAWLRPVVEPFSVIVMRMLLGMKALVGLSYGWVLVIFGLLIRLVMWPLQQTAMRTSIKMQAIQPELQAVQKRYANDPEAQRTAMMKLYSDHGMSPFSPLMGCLPMLIPMPILMALYFVFQNTIEFRGVPFLWLPDISLKDPYYITPIVMGVSMLVMSLIGLRAGPPNPQAKMMAYMMPVMFTVIFLNFASGLNLYYAVQNLVGLPQQWLLTRERVKATNSPVVKGPVVKGPAFKPRK
jgi:YidC/Oxa1 family membrane protein insertase